VIVLRESFQAKGFSYLTHFTVHYLMIKSTKDVLIIQDPNTSGPCPKPYQNGGRIVFRFDSSVYFSDIGLMDADETQAYLKITYADNVAETYKFTSFGDNSVQRVIVSKANVIKFEVIFITGSGAVTDINFCTLCGLPAGSDANENCIVAGNTVTNTLDLIEKNDFEANDAQDSLQGWTHGMINSNESSNFTKFLGLYNQSSDSPYKTFTVPTHASTVFLDMDFYMIDNWSVDQEIWIFVDEARVPIQISVATNPVVQNGNTSLGILWTSSPNGMRINLGFLPYLDQKYHISIEIPASTQLFSDGTIRLSLALSNTTTVTDGYAGWDNIKVSARYKCDEVVPSTTTASMTSQPNSGLVTEPISTSVQPAQPPSVTVSNFPTLKPTQFSIWQLLLINPTAPPTQKPTSVLVTGSPDPSKFQTSTPTLPTLVPPTVTLTPTLPLSTAPTKSPTAFSLVTSPPTKNPTTQPISLLQALLGTGTASPTTTKPTKSPTIAPTSPSPTSKPTAPPTSLVTSRPTSVPTTAKPSSSSLLGILSLGLLQGPSTSPIVSPSPTKSPTLKVI
jgi:hypothetical protein